MSLKTLFSALSTICLLISLSISLGYFKDRECHPIIFADRVMARVQYLILFVLYFSIIRFLAVFA